MSTHDCPLTPTRFNPYYFLSSDGQILKRWQGGATGVRSASQRGCVAGCGAPVPLRMPRPLDGAWLALSINTYCYVHALPRSSQGRSAGPAGSRRRPETPNPTSNRPAGRQASRVQQLQACELCFGGHSGRVRNEQGDGEAKVVHGDARSRLKLQEGLWLLW